MKTTQYVLKHRTTGEFVVSRELVTHLAWTPDLEAAARFDSATGASLHAISENIADEVTFEPVAGPEIVTTT